MLNYKKVLKENGLDDWNVVLTKSSNLAGRGEVRFSNGKWVSKKIYIDEDLTPKERDQVFLHELAHIKAGIPKDGESFHNAKFEAEYKRLSKKYNVPLSLTYKIGRAQERWDRFTDDDKMRATQCRVGEIYIPGYRRKDGTYVHGYCKKI